MARPGPASVVTVLLCLASAGVSAEVVRVFAAASLTEPFREMAALHERHRAGDTVELSFAGSQVLRAQIEQGAPADVFASADTRHMDALARATRVSAPHVFARNEPVLVVSRESEGSIRSLADLARADRIVVGAPEVPIGRYTLQILDRAEATLGADFRARVEAHVVSRELDVRHVLAKVSLGEAQAGIVYRSDAVAARDHVHVVPIPPALSVVAEYPVAVVRGGAHPSLARAWIALLLSPEGQRVLRQAGFSPASGSASAT